MLKKRRKAGIAAVLLAAVLVLAGAALFWRLAREEPKAAQEPAADADIELSAWLADWQWQAGLEDAGEIGSGLQGLQLFAVYFNQDGRLYFTEALREALPDIHEIAGDATESIGLTIVNDRINPDGTSVQKDAELVSKLIATEESRTRHIAEIMETMSSYHLDRIEIDYEKVKDEDWERLCLFYDELYDELQSAGKSLRIVLEPGAPLDSVSLPEGPEYVMMAYNLYGTHSGPGPKADYAMIRKLADKMARLPGDPVMAFSTGGFDWAESGEITSVTEQAAEKLAGGQGESLIRDDQSGALSFKYRDDKGLTHTVWYGDGQTMAGWIQAAGDQGITKIAIWKLGGLGQGTLDYFRAIPL
ncbi:glycosyl hydrolase family 18 protein [Paenibacillus sp. M1]|uniref:Glycosyl hydrolase family 18 protein n=1 Tax=Paenibacillus haidiansis TaxID=1574488 RepID=A0ABU7VNH4_9BACL